MSEYPLVRRRDVGMAYLLWLAGLFGLCGIHRFYMGRVWSGLLWFFTGGLCFVGQLLDLFFMPRMVEDANEGRAGW